MPHETLADVALRATIPGVEPVFSYRVPPFLRAIVQPGQLVWVPLRRQRVQGIVLDVYDAPHALAPDSRTPLRDIDDIADPEAALTPAQLRLARWVSSYYRAPLYEALALTLPPGVSQEAEPTWQATQAGLEIELGALPERERAVLYFLRQRGELPERELRRNLRGSDADLREVYYSLLERGLVMRGASLSRQKARPRIERLVRLAIAPDAVEPALVSLDRAPKQQAALRFLVEKSVGAAAPVPAIPTAELARATGAGSGIVHALVQRGLVEQTIREVRRDPLAGDAVPPDVPPPLSNAQERAWHTVERAIGQQRAHAASSASAAPKPILLHGVTGSGKTELYLRAIGRMLRQGKQALVIVPEIALTAQLVRRFAARFPGTLAVLHSGLSLGERYDEWRRLRNGTASLAIGSRSAVFAPLPNLGLIIVDEEHETSFKHDTTPRYHARDTAVYLAELTGSVLILGSATPALESYAAARRGTYDLITLSERVGMSFDADGLPRPRPLPLPPVRIVDMRHELKQGNRSIFSRPLQFALAGALERREQTVLFLNRRGAAAFVMCRDCGFVLNCPNCSTPLAVHYEEELTDDGPRRTSDPPVSLLTCHSCNHRAGIPLHCPECWSTRIKSFGVGTQRVVDAVTELFPDARVMRWDRDSVSRKGEHSRLLDRFLNHDADVLVGTQMIAKGLDLPLVSVVGVVAADTALNLPDFRAGERAFQLLTQVAGRAGRRGSGANVIIQTYTPDHYALLAAQEHDYAAFYQQEMAFREQTAYPPFSRLVRFVYTAPNEMRCRVAAEQLATELRELAQVLQMDDWGIIGPAPAFFQRVRNRYRWHLLLRAADPTLLLNALRLPYGWTLDVDPVHVL